MFETFFGGGVAYVRGERLAASLVKRQEGKAPLSLVSVIKSQYSRPKRFQST